MIIKVIGLLLLVAAGAFLGFSAAAGLSRRAAALEKIQRLLIQLGSQIRYTAAPVGELLAAAASSPEFQSLPFLKAAAADLQIDEMCIRDRDRRYTVGIITGKRVMNGYEN